MQNDGDSPKLTNFLGNVFFLSARLDPLIISAKNKMMEMEKSLRDEGGITNHKSDPSGFQTQASKKRKYASYGKWRCTH